MRKTTPVEARPGRRERNKQRVMDRLYTSALELFAEQGYDQTSIDEIAERADVSRGTFFNYFQRKEDLITTWGERRRSAMLARLEVAARERGTVGLPRELDEVMAALIDINEAERDITPAMLMAWVKTGRPISEEPYTARIFASLLAEAGRRGEVPEGIDPQLAGNVLKDIYFGALFNWARQPEEPVDLAGEMRARLEMFVHGILHRPTPPRAGDTPAAPSAAV